MRRSRRRTLLGAAAAGIVGGLAGCLGFLSGNTTKQTQSLSWPMSGADPRNTCVSRAGSIPDAGVKRAWRADLDDETGLAVDVITGSEPVVADGTVYVPSTRDAADGGFRVHALSTADATERWRSTFVDEREETSIDVGTIAVDENRVYAGNVERFHALDRETGEKLWSVGRRMIYPTPVDGTLYGHGRTDDGSLSYLGLDPATGEVRWADESDGDPHAYGTFAVAEDRLVALELGGGAFRLRGVSLTDGETVWTYPLGNAGRPFPDLVSVSEGVAVAGVTSVVHRDRSVENFVVGVDVDHGEKRWRHSVDGFLVGGYALAGGTAYFTTTSTMEGSTLVGVDLDDGEVTLSKSTSDLYGRTPVSDGDAVVFAGGESVGAFGLDDGAARWTDAVGDEFADVTALGDGAVFDVERVKGVTCYRP